FLYFLVAAAMSVVLSAWSCTTRPDGSMFCSDAEDAVAVIGGGASPQPKVQQAQFRLDRLGREPKYTQLAFDVRSATTLPVRKHKKCETKGILPLTNPRQKMGV